MQLTLKANCNNFKISGAIAYNKAKSAVTISEIDYCGEEDNNIYKNISCTLYENNKNGSVKLYDCEPKENIKLDNYLKDITFSLDDYKSSCDNQNDSLELEITATNENDELVTYKIPLISENCD